MTIATLLQANTGLLNQQAPNAWLAIQDAAMHDAENVKLYTTEQIEHGHRIEKFVRSVFPQHRVYLNYRKKYIAVKVEGLTLKAAESTQAELLETLLEMQGVAIKARGTNVIFQIKRS